MRRLFLLLLSLILTLKGFSQVGGTDLPNLKNVTVKGVLTIGTGIGMYTLPAVKGPNYSIMQMINGSYVFRVPYWENALGNPSEDGYILNSTRAGVRSWIPLPLGGGIGTISSVGVNLPSEFIVSGSPLIANGTISAMWDSQSANKFFASPDGVIGFPQFRYLSASDIPALSWSKITSGFPSTLAGYGITDAASSLHIHSFSSLTGLPSTLAGYGITDAAGIAHTHAFSALTSKPTTLAGYGIADAATSAHSHAFSAITSKPTTLSGYGITDAALSSHVHSFLSMTDLPTNLAGYGITDAAALIHLHAFSTLTSKPTTLSGYGITDAAASSHVHAFSAITSKPTTLSGYGITDCLIDNLVPAQSGQNGKILGTNGTSVSWITNSSGVAWGAITGTFSNQTDLNSALNGKAASSHFHSWTDITSFLPTTLSGYGITDAALSSHSHAFSALTGKPTTLSGYGITDAASSSHVHAFSTLSGLPTTLSGYGITDAAASSHVHAFSILTGLPTTISGYGITDAALSSHSHAFSALTGKPTTLSGYGITDAATISHDHSALYERLLGNPSVDGYVLSSTAAGVRSWIANGTGGGGGGSWGSITGTLSSQIDLNSALAAKSDLAPSYIPNGNAGSGKTIDWNNSTVQSVNRDQSTTITMTAPSLAPGKIHRVTLVFIHANNANAYTVTFSPVPKWTGGIAPAFTNTALAVDIITLLYDKDNNIYYGMYGTDFK